MNEIEIRKSVAQLDSSKESERETAWDLLRPLGVAVIPYLAEFYPQAKKAQGRVAIIFYAMRYARVSEEAFALGVRALNDKGTLARYRACGLCAYSQRSDALPYLTQLLKHIDSKTVEDAEAAIYAIRKKNHHFFIDRTHSGSTFWEVNPGDVLG